MRAKKVIDMKLTPHLTVSELFHEYRKMGGFTSQHLVLAHDILLKMLSDTSTTRFLSFPACLVATGLRGVFAQMVPYFDAIITTTGTLDHDLARAWGGTYYQGDFDMDDKQLHAHNIHRLGNILIPRAHFGDTLEKKLYPILTELATQKTSWGGYELIEEVGKRIHDSSSIVATAARHHIPIIVPGFFDGVFGVNVYMFAQGKKFSIDLMQDEKKMEDIVFSSRRRGALMLGGGISKHHTIGWNQFKGGLDYAVYITTAIEQDGSLSGARTKEAISWGKVSKNATHVSVWGEASILLPLLWASVCGDKHIRYAPSVSSALSRE